MIVLPSSVDDADDEFAWIAYNGRWGEHQSGPFNGPTGPTTKPQWDAPIDWHNNLRSASVEIPGGAAGNSSVLDTFCSVAEFSAHQLREAQQSPTRTIIVITIAAAALRFLARRTDWSALPPVPLRQRRRTGQMIRGAVVSYSTSRGAIGAIAILYLPAAIAWASSRRRWVSL